MADITSLRKSSGQGWPPITLLGVCIILMQNGKVHDKGRGKQALRLLEGCHLNPKWNNTQSPTLFVVARGRVRLLNKIYYFLLSLSSISDSEVGKVEYEPLLDIHDVLENLPFKDRRKLKNHLNLQVDTSHSNLI